MWRWSRHNPLDRSPNAPGGGKLIGMFSHGKEFVHPDILKLAGMEQRGWAPRMRKIKNSDVPIAGLGFAAPFYPNAEPTVAATSWTWTATTETCIINASTTPPSLTTLASNTLWCQIPPGSLRAGCALRVLGCGIFSTTVASTTLTWTSRVGSSTTLASNATLGATGAMNPNTGATITAGLWWYEAHGTVRATGSGTTASMVSHATVGMTTTAGGTWTSPGVITGMSGNSTATFDSTLANNFLIDNTASAAAGSTQLTQFMLAAWD